MRILRVPTEISFHAPFQTKQHLRNYLVQDSTASAIRDGVQELRQKLKDAEARLPEILRAWSAGSLVQRCSSLCFCAVDYSTAATMHVHGILMRGCRGYSSTMEHAPYA